MKNKDATRNPHTDTVQSKLLLGASTKSCRFFLKFEMQYFNKIWLFTVEYKFKITKKTKKQTYK
jgi:hypothetical protein